MTAATSTRNRKRIRAASHSGIHDDSPKMMNAPRAGIDQNSMKSVPTIHPDPMPASLEVLRSQAFAASTSAMTRLRMSSGTSPTRVKMLSSTRSRKPRGSVMSRSATTGVGDVVHRVFRGILHRIRGLLGRSADVIGGVLADLEGRVEPLTGRALAAGGLGHLDGAIPDRGGQGHSGGLRVVLRLRDLLLDGVEVPDLERLVLDLLVPLAAGARAKHVACRQSYDESYFAPHVGLLRSTGVLPAPQGRPACRFRHPALTERPRVREISVRPVPRAPHDAPARPLRRRRRSPGRVPTPPATRRQHQALRLL